MTVAETLVRSHQVFQDLSPVPGSSRVEDVQAAEKIVAKVHLLLEAALSLVRVVVVTKHPQ